MRQYIDNAQDINGNAIPGAAVLVSNYPSGTAANIFSDNGLTLIVGSQVTADETGQFSFYAADGDYTLQISAGGFLYKTLSPVSMFDGAAQLTFPDSGNSNNYQTLNSALEKALRPGLRANFLASFTNSGPATFSYNGLLAKSIVFPAAVAVLGGFIAQGGIYGIEYDGTNWQMRSNSALASPFFPTTPAEQAALVTPSTNSFSEGDIRRYGASTAASDNGPAINTALTVSSAGGAAAFIPPGRWPLVTQLTPAANSSMYGTGSSSQLLPQSTSQNSIEFQAGTFYSTGESPARFFRDFAITGFSASASSAAAISINFSNGSGGRVIANFDNIGITNFNKCFYLRNSWNCTISRILAYNCYNGLYFFGQSAKTAVWGCSFLRGTIAGSGGAWGVSFQATSGENPQGIQMSGSDWFGYDIGCNAIQHLLVQIDDCSFSSCQQNGVVCTSTLGGFMFTNCWVEMQNSSAVTAVVISPLAGANFQDIRINGCHITNDNPFAGSIGVTVANAQVGVVVNDNQIQGFEIGIQNTASSGFISKWNRIGVVNPGIYSTSSQPIVLISTPADNEIGPNFIIPGTPQPATMSNAATAIGVVSSANFPVGTPVQLDATANGFPAGVTYYVLTSTGNILTIGPVAGGTAIASTGNTSVNIFSAPNPVSFSGATPPGFQFYGRGGYIATVTGYGTPLLAPVGWLANGHSVTLTYVSDISGTSTAVSLGSTGAPSFLNPITAKFLLSTVTNAGTVLYGSAQISTVGAQTFGIAPAAASGFTASGSKAIKAQELTYAYT